MELDFGNQAHFFVALDGRGRRRIEQCKHHGRRGQLREGHRKLGHERRHLEQRMGSHGDRDVAETLHGPPCLGG